ncbi:MAG TPA: protein kinase [Bryobacteraceae bacterium]|nr:protein kinase [Bryobacteraceae bacterium]
MIPRRLGHFEILEKLGEGGMGEVYKACDLELERLVALKLLRPTASNPELKRRFGFEARAASALNHPNIVTIYEISNFEGCEFIAMELVEGRTLGQMLSGGMLPLEDVLNYAVQVADALATAHAGQIVHRDLKPANVMVTPRGLVKVLDFGLAKSIQSGISAAGDVETITTNTEDGAIVGTLAYMSPEQAEGRRVDARSDIFSFGAVLYELATGQRAFYGETKVATLAAILRDEPRPIAAMRPGVPRELDDLVRRCLRKNPEERFQQMEDVRAQLQQLSAGGGALPRWRSLRFSGSRKVAVSAVSAVSALLLVGAAVYLYTASGHREAAPKEYALIRATNDAGLTTEPAISRDGKLLAYASDRAEGNLDIWVRQTAGGDSVRLTRDPADEHEPSFSPDGTHIAFRSERDGGGIYVVPSLGGQIRMVAKQGRRPRFSPDGRWIAYWIRDRYTSWGKVYVIPAAGGAPRQVAADLASARAPVWAPGGKSLLVSGSQVPGQPRAWWFVPIENSRGASVQTGDHDWFVRAGLNPNSQQVLPGDWWNNRMIFAAAKGDTQNIWSVPLSERSFHVEGAPERVTAGSSIDGDPVLSAGGSVVFSSGTQTIGLWAVPMDADSGVVTGPRSRLPGNGGFQPDGASLSADGKFCAFQTQHGDVTEIRLRNMSTGQETVVTATSDSERPSEGIPNRVSRPVISPAGARIAFRHMAGKSARVAIVPADGGLAEDSCQDCGRPVGWLPGDRLVLFATGDRLQRIGLLDTQTRERRIVLESGTWSASEAKISPDSRFVAFRGKSGADRSTIFVAPWNNGTPMPEAQWIPVTDPPDYASVPQWSPNGKLLYFVMGDYEQISARRLDPRTKRPLGPSFSVETFPLARYKLGNSSIAVSPRQMIFTVNETLGDVWIRSPESR